MTVEQRCHLALGDFELQLRMRHVMGKSAQGLAIEITSRIKYKQLSLMLKDLAQ